MYFDLYVELDRVDKHDSRLGYGEFEAILPKLLRWGAEITPRYPPRCRRDTDLNPSPQSRHIAPDHDR